jgi:hypothetical protein
MNGKRIVVIGAIVAGGFMRTLDENAWIVIVERGPNVS